MSGLEQLLYLVVVPALIVAVVWALASMGGPQAARRYRPGRPYAFTPVWYLANHRRGAHAGDTEQRPELPSGSSRDTGSAEPTGSEAMQGSTGGASDRW